MANPIEPKPTAAARYEYATCPLAAGRCAGVAQADLALHRADLRVRTWTETNNREINSRLCEWWKSSMVLFGLPATLAALS